MKTVFISHPNKIARVLSKTREWSLIQNQQQLTKSDLRGYNRIIVQAEIEWGGYTGVDFYGLDLIDDIAVSVGISNTEIILASTTALDLVKNRAPRRFNQASLQIAGYCNTMELVTTTNLEYTLSRMNDFYYSLSLFADQLLEPQEQHDQSILDLIEWAKTEFANVKENGGWVENCSFKFFQSRLLPKIKALRNLFSLINQNDSIPKDLLVSGNPYLNPLLEHQTDIIKLINRIFEKNDHCVEVLNLSRFLSIEICSEAKEELEQLQNYLREVVFYSVPKIQIKT